MCAGSSTRRVCPRSSDSSVTKQVPSTPRGGTCSDRSYVTVRHVVEVHDDPAVPGFETPLHLHREVMCPGLDRHPAHHFEDDDVADAPLDYSHPGGTVVRHYVGTVQMRRRMLWGGILQ